jgi:hypothetical protein
VAALAGAGQARAMLTGLASTSSAVFAHGENLSITGAIIFVMSGVAFITGSRPSEDSGALSRWKAIQTTVMISPLLIVAGGVMMIAAVV